MKYVNLTKLLTDRLYNNATWAELFSIISKTTHELVTKPRQKILTMQDPDQLHVGDTIDTTSGTGTIQCIRINADSTLDEVYVEISDIGIVKLDIRTMQPRSILIDIAKGQGFDFLSDKLSDRDYYRIAKYVGQYWPMGGTEQFVAFISFIKNIRLEMIQLWSDTSGFDVSDEYPWLEEFQNTMTPIWKGGINYPTSHVELRYDYDETNVDLNEIEELFYRLAPINLVLQRVVSVIRGTVSVYLGGANQTTVQLMGKSDSPFNLSSTIVGATGQVSYVELGKNSPVIEGTSIVAFALQSSIRLSGKNTY